MPFDGGGTDITVPAAADLSSYQFRFITLDHTGRGTLCPTGSAILGVLQNKPAATDRAARVRVDGISQLKCGAAVAAGDYVASGVQGYGTTTTTAGINVGGISLNTTGGSGDFTSILVRPHTA